MKYNLYTFITIVCVWVLSKKSSNLGSWTFSRIFFWEVYNFFFFFFRSYGWAIDIFWINLFYLQTECQCVVLVGLSLKVLLWHALPHSAGVAGMHHRSHLWSALWLTVVQGDCFRDLEEGRKVRSPFQCSWVDYERGASFITNWAAEGVFSLCFHLIWNPQIYLNSTVTPYAGSCTREEATLASLPWWDVKQAKKATTHISALLQWSSL